MSKPAPEPYESPHPECRVLAHTEPAGSVRLDVSKERAAVIARHVQDARNAHDGEGLVQVYFQMDRKAYTHIAENIGRLLSDVDKSPSALQVILDPDPAISIMVILGANQIQGLSRDMKRDLKRSSPDSTFVWNVGISTDGAEMLVKQIILAVKGEENPADTVAEREGVR